ncbi:ABC transporter permease subunit [Actinomyces sp. B33]|uniref:ABC transporter permease n=1 Tax=Actinomyces sp. B33 TaxID=2942131 RepID=UPI002341E647|nr:ABC transporter permease subunit [Actinomyces sp. B33]MDC4232415.1 ABC transporter permease subunit [Actinomyces sp. B33]
MSLLLDALAWIADPAHWTGGAGIGRRLVEHLGVTGAVVALAALVALPVGVAIGHTRRFGGLVTLTTGAARAVPTLGVLTLAGLWLGIGVVAPIIALLVLAIPPMLAGAYSGVASADPSTVDAARAIGLTETQIVIRVELPAAAPIIMAGLRSTVLQVVATATLAAYTADAGLGRFLYAGLKTRDYPQMLAGALLVVLLALVLDAALALGQRRLDRRLRPEAPAPERNAL